MSQQIFSELVNKAKQLYQFSLEDLQRGHWSSYDRHLSDYNRLLQEAYQYNLCVELLPISPVPKWYKRSLPLPSTIEKAKLEEIVQKAQAIYEVLKNVLLAPAESDKDISWAMSRIQRICDKLHLIVKHLEREYHGRRMDPITNEYDLQWLLQGILSLDFDDVRAEEWTPSHSGGSARMDFLIPSYAIALETKMTRKGLDDKKIGEELIIDLARYQEHPNCRILNCFIYDPDNYLRNARGLERDIENMSTQKLIVKVFARP